ncbi:MAG: thiamine pyrophosphate-dependent enzyme [Candidatus Brocadiia bacterium]|nr:thiamine pyrophosphate-dependent enzyme [Candidatus Brocadiia bacterium]
MDAQTEQVLCARPECMVETATHYCPGCGHGIVHRLIAEIIDELGIREQTIGIAPVGCAVLAYRYIDIDWSEAAHGRPPAVATGLKRAHPDRTIFTIQGDGDLASIGMAEIIHTANRGENITVIFINNAVYGMTQGQMAPTTLVGQKTKTTPRGRDAATEGHPIKVCELLGQLEGPRLLARVTVATPKRVREAKRMLKKAFQYQIDGIGFSLVEVLSACPTYWRLGPSECGEFIETTMAKVFPLGVVKDAPGQ